MRKLLILMGALLFVACGDDAVDNECSGVGDCAPGERCDEGICVPSDTSCVSLQDPVNGAVDQPADAATGDTASYSCDEGYVLEGDATRTCEESGDWSSSAPRCVDEEDPEPPVHCSVLDGIADGAVDQPEEASPGDEATYSCDEGLVLLGSATRTCGEDGEWTGAAPICAEPLPCDEELSDPAGGSVSVPDEPIVGDHASYSCDEGYLLVGKAERLCGEGGVWAGDAPTCELSMCLSATEFRFSEGEDPDIVYFGFDLDGQNTEEASDAKDPATGCGMADAPGGVDNQLGALLALISGAIDVEGSINALVGDALTFTTALQQTEDDGVLLDFSVNGELVVEALPLTEESAGQYGGEMDVLVLDLTDLHVTDVEIPNEDDPEADPEIVPVIVDLKITLNKARVLVDSGTGEVTLGGTIVYGDEESGDDTLRPGIVGIFDAIVEAGGEASVDVGTLDLFFGILADMALDGENCVDMSLGLKLDNTIGLCE